MPQQSTPCSADADLWFADGREKQARAKSLCQQCPVRQACLDVALEAGETWGIWGGTDPQERKEIQHARHAAALVIVEVAA